MTQDQGAPAAADRATAAEPEVSALRDGIPSAGSGFAQEWWDWQHRQAVWEDCFCDLLREGQDYDKLGTDDYDASLEIYGATNDWRLTREQQEYLQVAGFAKVYVNHQDGCETHYGLHGATLPVRGWRRRYVSDSTVETTNVIAGEPNPGYYEISYWPEGWNTPGTADWLETGYMRVVPDPLDPFAQAIETGTAKTEGLGPEDESAVATGDAPDTQDPPQSEGIRE